MCNRSIHFVETAAISDTKPPSESLVNQIEIADIASIELGSTRAKPTSPTLAKKPITSPLPNESAESRVFVLVMRDGSRIRMQASDEDIYSEWVDGLHMLRPDGRVATEQTANLIQSLTDIGVKIQLLDLTGERVQIPSEVKVNGIRGCLRKISCHKPPPADNLF